MRSDLSPANSAPIFIHGLYLEIHFVDGQALSPTDFAEVQRRQRLAAKKYSGTYGSNGYYLDFSDNSSNAALGTDSSGNSNIGRLITCLQHNFGLTNTSQIGELANIFSYQLPMRQQ